MKWTRISLWVMTILAAIAFLLAGIPKVAAVEIWREQFAGWGYPEWFLRAVGLVEVIGALLLVVPRTALVGALVLAVVMAGAVYTHVANGEGTAFLRPLIFIFVMTMIIRIRLTLSRIRAAGSGS